MATLYRETMQGGVILSDVAIGGVGLSGKSIVTPTYWDNPEYALVFDGVNFASVDLELNPSEFLVVRDFALDLEPSWRVHGIRVVIGNRWASGRVRDAYLYLVLGNKIISNNMAKWNLWSELPESVFYGSTGFDDKEQFRDVTLDPWTVEEINDPTFGIALAVQPDSFADWAKVDGFAVEFTLEGFGRTYQVVSHVNVSGAADALVNWVPGEGGMSAGGFAMVKPYWITMQNGPQAGGHAPIGFHYKYTTSGEIVVGGAVDASPMFLYYTSTGEVEITGSAIVSFKKSIWEHESDGNVIFILGGAVIKCGNLGTLMITGSFQMSIPYFKGNTTEFIIAEDIDELTDTVASCGCLSIPLFVEVSHNMVRDNIFAKFLARNNYTMASVMTLYHNAPNNSWQANLHYRGLSADANTEEKWDLVFELQCTNNMGGIVIGRKIWKLAISIFRKNLTTLEDFDTRIIIGLMPELICETNANELDFKVEYDTQTDLVLVAPDVSIYQATIFDNIGLFKNQSWITIPNLVFEVSQSGLREPLEVIDVTDKVIIDDDLVLASS